MQSNTVRFGVLAALIAVAAVLFIVLGGDDDEDSNGAETTATQTSTGAETATVDTANETSLVFRNGRPVGGVKEMEADGGDSVFIVVDSDAGAEIHVHGYEIEAPVEAGEKSQVAFTADLEGVFEIELHLDSGEEVQIAELTVNPS